MNMFRLAQLGSIHPTVPLTYRAAAYIEPPAHNSPNRPASVPAASQLGLFWLGQSQPACRSVSRRFTPAAEIDRCWQIWKTASYAAES